MDASDGHICAVVVFVLLLLTDFMLAAAGSALQSLNDTVLSEEAQQLKDEPMPLIRACWFYLVVTALPAAWICTAAKGLHSAVCAVLCMTAVYLFGKSLPRMAGRRYRVRFGVRSIRFVKAAITVSRPFTFVLSVITDLIARLFGINPRALEDEVTEDEILSMVNEGHEQGVLDEHEAAMISNIFRLDDTQAKDIMTHRKAVAALDSSQNLGEAIAFMVQETNSRYPVYEGNIDNIIGVLHFKDAMIARSKGDYDQWLIRDIPDLIRAVDFIPETRSIDELFRTMQHSKMQMVIVVDEYGETAGLVTMEDILEEIVGNILDEYDEEEHYIVPDGSDAYVMAGMTPLQQVEEVLGVSLETDDYETLNGFLVSLLDRIPDEQDQSVVSKDGWRFAIREVEDRMIKSVRVEKIDFSVSEEID